MLKLIRLFFPLVLFFPPLSAQEMVTLPGRPDRTGVILAAPHDGFDLHTGKFVTEMAHHTGFPAIIARGYRNHRENRFYNVNRPTERLVVGEHALRKELQSQAATEVFQQYQARLGQLRPASTPLSFYVEIHGHARSYYQLREEDTSWEKVPVQVIELATKNFTPSFLKRIKRKYEHLVPRCDRVPLLIDRLDPRYEYNGHRLPFLYNAEGLKERGSFQDRTILHGLHFELPPSLRADPLQRNEYAQALGRLITWIAKELTKD